MIDARSRTSTVKSTRRRTSRKVLKLEESLNGELSNGSFVNKSDTIDLDRTWNSMDYSDYLEYSRRDIGGDKCTSLCDTLFGDSLFGFRWDIIEDIQKRKSGNLENSRISHSTEIDDEDDGRGFIFRFYRKFGFYWNVFPKTDYCYLSSSKDYQKEISPGIPMVPNLSRFPLQSYVRRSSSSSAQQSYNSARTETERGTESRLSVGFTEKPLMSSTACGEGALLGQSSDSTRQGWHPSIEARKSTINHNGNYKSTSKSESASWRLVKTISRTIVTIVRTTVVTTASTLSFATESVGRPSSADGDRRGRRRRTCSWLPLFLFLLLLVPLVYYLFPGVVGAREGEIQTIPYRPTSDFVSWSVSSLISAVGLVKESFLFIPSLYVQLLALLASNASSSSAESPCVDPSLQLVPGSQFPTFLNFPTNFSEEKTKELTETIQKLKTEMAGQNDLITTWIERIQGQLNNLTEEMKKMSSNLEGDQKEHFSKLKGELADLRKAVVDVRDQTSIDTSASPSERMVERAVAKYHADRTGKPDYALQSAGGYVVRVKCAQTYTKTAGNFLFLGFSIREFSNGPETIIKPGTMPGECWAFEGSFAQVTLRLASKVRVTSVSLEHSPKELAPHGHISSAPKQFSTWAMVNENDEDPVFLGRFTFEDNGQSLQTFDVEPYEEAVEVVEVRVESNHGHPEYTCVYRFRVHGVPPTV